MLCWGRVGGWRAEHDQCAECAHACGVNGQLPPVRCFGPVVFLCQQCQCVSCVCGLSARLCLGLQGGVALTTQGDFAVHVGQRRHCAARIVCRG